MLIIGMPILIFVFLGAIIRGLDHIMKSKLNLSIYLPLILTISVVYVLGTDSYTFSSLLIKCFIFMLAYSPLLIYLNKKTGVLNETYAMFKGALKR